VDGWSTSSARFPVHHAAEPPESEPAARFVVMEMKLYRYIMTPAMIAAWITRSACWQSFGLKGGWLHAKLLLVVAHESAHHGLQGRWRSKRTLRPA